MKIIKTIIYISLNCFVLLLFNACQKKVIVKTDSKVKQFDYSIDINGIPNDTVDINDSRLELKNGIYYLNKEEFSGVAKKNLPRVKVTTYSSVYNGKLHGVYKSFFENGSPYEVRSYKNNLATGKHYYYWKRTGNLRYECVYYEDKREGMQKKWYPNGKPFMFFNYVSDRMDGLQQAWRKNGKIYINFEAKNGRRYGLQRASLCYELENEKVVMNE